MSNPRPRHAARRTARRSSRRKRLPLLPLALAGCLAALGPQLAQAGSEVDVRTTATKPLPNVGRAADTATTTTDEATDTGTTEETSSPEDLTADEAEPTADPTLNDGTDTQTATTEAGDGDPAATQQQAATDDGTEEEATGAGNPDCTLRVPPRPLSGRGLAKPYILTGTGDGGPCHQANPAQGAFVEATIVNRRTGRITVYHPLVIDQGTRPAVRPVPPRLRRGDVVGIWFGANSDTLTLRDARGSLTQGNCVNGFDGSIFGQFAYCNAPEFFDAANQAVDTGRLDIPALGTAKDGLPCPTVRDFSVIDQDQSDNVTTTYLVTPDGRTAQDTAAARRRLPRATTLSNGSDNALLDNHIDPALGCTPFTAPSRTDRGTPVPSLALNELHAAAHQGEPIALIPLNNPMTLVDGQQSPEKTDLYRLGVNQAPLGDGDDGDPEVYCDRLDTAGRERIMTQEPLLSQAPAPGDPTATLFDFLVQRLDDSLVELGCNGE